MIPQLSPKLGKVAIYQSDSQGRCVYVNSALCEMFGMEGSKFLGRIGTITDTTDAKKHFPEEDAGSG